MSIGVDRLLFALNQLENFKIDKIKNVLVCIVDEKYMDEYFKIVNELRANSISSEIYLDCLLYTSPSPRDLSTSRMPSSA